MSRKPKKPPAEPEAVTGEVTYEYRLSQNELLDAANMYLRARGDIPKTTVGHFRHRFGIIGNPQMIIMGDPPPDAGKIYLEWHFTPARECGGAPDVPQKAAMTIEELQTEVEKRHASFMLACTGAGRLAVVTLTEHPDHADERNARPSDRWYGSGTDRSYAKAVNEAIKAYDASVKRLGE